ncbi:MAG: hypothetical protein UX13_C0048G0005 [Candidatus Woesebacteria bacterium GW2011_GWB1_45_5]|uniref:SCP domain-containing protein n=1 Tax=Candidatus Woesebacteria bacterium GW2011_GWB1_45_5 TaxID=1618581 RepID=A0A0G1PUL1_9BACT|nr:MAG: hypothetical protein UX13_C0048G0005 [Candidatus Woesebacteria bacterium GW2011_GWB1_45_5]
MKILKLLAHIFVPHESNNQKAKILHPSGILTLAFLVVSFQLLLNFLPKVFPRVLGYAANISPSEVVRLTNEKRVQNGLLPLAENSVLSSAALAKGNDMLAKGYWAHFAPDGTTPWSFFTNFGYRYRYAGENLARDFSNSSSAVDAWMNSATHRENILNGNYKEVGIGVVEGSLAGVDTTIIVQFFGTPQNAAATIPVAQAKETATKAPLALALSIPTLSPSPVSTMTPAPTPTPTPGPEVGTAFVSPFSSTKNLSLAIVGILLLVLSVDLIIVRRKRIARIGGRTLAHIAFFGMILAVILILKAGEII